MAMGTLLWTARNYRKLSMRMSLRGVDLSPSTARPSSPHGHSIASESMASQTLSS